MKKLNDPQNTISDKIKLHHFHDTGRGVHAQAYIHMNEEVLLIRNLITPMVAVESDKELVNMLDNSSGAKIDTQDLMTMWLISQSEKESAFSGYISLLPKTSTCPLAVHHTGQFVFIRSF